MIPSASKGVRLLIEELSEDQGNAPTIVLVGDYGERERIVAAMQDEAEVHDVELVRASTVEEAAALSRLDHRPAVAFLVDAGTGARWGAWLDASRELLPSFRFVMILTIDTEFSKLARAAPALMSWAKGNVVEKLLLDSGDDQGDEAIEAELRALEQETGGSLAEFVRRWDAGEIDDAYENNVRIALARRALAGKSA